MKNLCALLLCIPSFGYAQDFPKSPPQVEIKGGMIQWNSFGYNDPSFVTLGPPEVADAVATITFKNTMVHDQSAEFSLSYNKIKVSFVMDFGVTPSGAEGLHMLPPSGYIIRPDYIQVEENTTEKAHVFEYLGG